MPPPFVSLCIPTFRRAAMLGELLGSIARESGSERENLEIVVSEDPSGEGPATLAALEHHRSALPLLRHEVSPERLGFDRNFLRVMSLAQGEWCWMLGDDDVIEPGGLGKALAALRAHPGASGATLGRHAYDATLEHRIYQRPFRQAATREFTDAGEMFLALLDQLGFLSSTVLRRSVFERVAGEPKTQGFLGSGYVQMWLLMRMVQAEPRWLALAEPCVGWRADNDSFNERGLLGRLRMDVEGYARVSAGIFGLDSPVHRQAMAFVARSHVRHHIVRAKLGGASLAYTRDALGLCLRHYARHPAWWLHTFPLLLLPAGLLRRARSAVQAARARLGR